MENQKEKSLDNFGNGVEGKVLDIKEKSFINNLSEKYFKFEDYTLAGSGSGAMIGGNFGPVGFVVGALAGGALFNYINYKSS
jgi:hypothetical protein